MEDAMELGGTKGAFSGLSSRIGVVVEFDWRIGFADSSGSRDSRSMIIQAAVDVPNWKWEALTGAQRAIEVGLEAGALEFNGGCRQFKGEGARREALPSVGKEDCALVKPCSLLCSWMVGWRSGPLRAQDLTDEELARSAAIMGENVGRELAKLGRVEWMDCSPCPASPALAWAVDYGALARWAKKAGKPSWAREPEDAVVEFPKLLLPAMAAQMERLAIDPGQGLPGAAEASGQAPRL